MNQHWFENNILERYKDEKTPYLLIDLKRIKNRFLEFKKHRFIKNIFYSMKSNPNKKIIAALAEMGSCFDAASLNEVLDLLSVGVDPKNIFFGNTIKKVSDIKKTFDLGIKCFVCDHIEDLEKLALHAKHSDVFFRLMCDGSGSDWELSDKFGTTKENVISLALRAKELGLNPMGVSFHVGSQQRDPLKWEKALLDVRYIFDELKKQNIYFTLLNLGGGFPSFYLKGVVNSFDSYMRVIEESLNKIFPEGIENVIIEPGRGMVADSGVIVSEVCSVRKHLSDYWVYIDVGVFNGLMETLGEAIKYPIIFEAKHYSREKIKVILAGPSCDSVDVMYKKNKYLAPKSIKGGDFVYIYGTGAYTRTYSSICFNGFDPLKEIIFND